MSKVEDEIREWLAKGGRPLESQVAAEFMKSNADVQQSPWFKDGETDKTREIDVVALYPGDLRPYLLSVEVECKSHNPPFVVLASERGDAITNRCLSRHARSVMPMKNDALAVSLNGTPIFDPSVPVGHALLTKSDGKGADLGWEGAMSAAKAAHWFATRFDEDERTECHLALPVLVCDQVLAVAELVNGETRVKEVDHARFLLKWPLGEATSVLVDIVRPPALAAFVEGCGRVADLLLPYFRQASDR